MLSGNPFKSKKSKEQPSETQPLLTKEDKKEKNKKYKHDTQALKIEQKKEKKELHEKHEEERKKLLEEHKKAKGKEKETQTSSTATTLQQLNNPPLLSSTITDDPIYKENILRLDAAEESITTTHTGIPAMPVETSNVLLARLREIQLITKVAHQPLDVQERIKQLEEDIKREKELCLQAARQDIIKTAQAKLDECKSQVQEAQTDVDKLQPQTKQFADSSQPKPKKPNSWLWNCIPCGGNSGEDDVEEIHDQPYSINSRGLTK